MVTNLTKKYENYLDSKLEVPFQPFNHEIKN